MKLNGKKKKKNRQFFQSEAEVAGLNRRMITIEEDLERAEEKLKIATEKLEETTHSVDESERLEEAMILTNFSNRLRIFFFSAFAFFFLAEKWWMRRFSLNFWEYCILPYPFDL